MSEQPVFLVVDLPNLFARARHAVRGTASEKAGMATLVVFRGVRAAHRRWRADHVVFCAEGRGRSWRHDLFPAYKARRRIAKAAKKPSERAEDAVLEEALDGLLEFLRDETRCTVLQAPGLEADDFVAHWIRRRPDARHVLVSSDSDFVQLLAPNVVIRDPLHERTLDLGGVTDDAGRRLAFAVDTASGRLRVGQPDPSFEPPADWWRLALFVKIVRGDSTDGVFPAYPGVRFEGSSKRVGLREAWEDRADKGWHWQNFMQQTWDKLPPPPLPGSPLPASSVTTVRVLDEFRFNETLIDLTRQPDEVQAAMDAVIDEAVSRPPPPPVGMAFLRWCARHDLPSLGREAEEHARYLGRGCPTLS